MSQTEHNETESEVLNATMRRAKTISDREVDNGRRYAITDALRQAGYSNEMLIDADLYIHFVESGDGLVGVVADSVPDGRHDEYHKIYHSTYMARIYFTDEQLEQYGFDVDGDTPMIFDTWGGDGCIALMPMDVREVVVRRGLTDPVDALPKRMREDYLAVEAGNSYREVAEEYAKEWESPVTTIEWNVERNHKEAKRRIEEYKENQP